jgi:glutathione peroxidase
MKAFAAALVATGLLAATGPSSAPAQTAGAASAANCPAYLDHEFRKLHSSQKVNLCQAFAGKPMLIVNTASHCGFTPQFKGLQAVHEKYRDKGLVVVGFSSNDFDQEDGDEAKAAETCFVNFGVTFTMIAQQPVRGPDANAVFRELARQTQEPGWNFNKYLVRADGTVVRHFDSRANPDSAEFQKEIEKVLVAGR